MAIEKVMILGAAVLILTFVALFGGDLLSVVQDDTTKMKTNVDSLRDASGTTNLK